MIAAANELAIFQAQYGSSGFGPVVDDVYEADLPDVLLAQGRRAKNIKSIVVAHNPSEGLLFTNPAVQSSDALENYIHSTLPMIMIPVNDTVAHTLQD